MAARYEYAVDEIREGMIGGKMSGDKLEKLLNDYAAEGWQLRAITSTEVIALSCQPSRARALSTFSSLSPDILPPIIPSRICSTLYS